MTVIGRTRKRKLRRERERVGRGESELGRESFLL